MSFQNKLTVAVLQGRFFSSLQNGDFRNIPCSFSSLFEIVPKKAKSMSKTFNTMIKWREAPVLQSGGSGGGGSNTPGRRLTRNLHNLLIVFATQQGNICQEGKQHKENKEDLSKFRVTAVPVSSISQDQITLGLVTLIPTFWLNYWTALADMC